MKTASWVLLLVLSILVILGSLVSTSIAYFHSGSDDVLTGSVTLEDVAGGRHEVEVAMQGRRATAAAFALAFGTLLLFVVLRAYRKGEVWAWWAVLVSSLAMAVVILARLIFLRSGLGAATGAVLLAVVVIALLLDARRLSA